MNKAVISEWCQALRSGKYKQGQGRLRVIHDFKPEKELMAQTKFCCLGVLCELYAQTDEAKAHNFVGAAYLYDAPKQAEQLLKNGSYRYGYPHIFSDGVVDRDNKATCMPPGCVLQWAGLSGETADTLATMNDNGDVFEEIADYIEELANTEEQNAPA